MERPANRFCATESDGSCATLCSKKRIVAGPRSAATMAFATANPSVVRSAWLIAGAIIDRARVQGLMRRGEEWEGIAEGDIIAVDLVAGRQPAVGDKEQNGINHVVGRPAPVRKSRSPGYPALRPGVRDGRVQAQHIAIVDRHAGENPTT